MTGRVSARIRRRSGFAMPSSASSSIGASTPSPASAASGTRATCTSRARPDFAHHVATYGPQTQVRLQGPHSQVHGRALRSGCMGKALSRCRRTLRRPGRRASRRLSDVRVEPDRLVRGQDGAEARRARRTGDGRPSGGHASSAPPRIAPSTTGSSMVDAASPPT